MAAWHVCFQVHCSKGHVGFAKDFEMHKLLLSSFARNNTHTHKFTKTKVPRAAWRWKDVTSRTYSNVCKIDGGREWWMVTHDPNRWEIFQVSSHIKRAKVRVAKATNSVLRTETQSFREFSRTSQIKNQRQHRIQKSSFSADRDTSWPSTFQDLDAFSCLRSPPDSNDFGDSAPCEKGTVSRVSRKVGKPGFTSYQGPKWRDLSKANRCWCDGLMDANIGFYLHKLRKVYGCVVSLPWESRWGINMKLKLQSAKKASKIAGLQSCFNDNDLQCGTQEILVSVVICLNFVVIIIEANYGAECDGKMTSHASMFNASHQKPHLTPQMTMKCMEMPGGCVPGWLSVINYCFVAFYTLEAFVAWRFGIFRPFRWWTWWNMV